MLTLPIYYQSKKSRCTASSENLDGGVSIRRCREHNDVLVEQKELGDLWDNYGLVGDVVVSIYCYSFLSLFFSSNEPMCAPAHSTL
jgi:hypothetical protein